MVRGSDLRWLNRDRLQEVKAGLATQHKWLPDQTLPFSEVVLYAYAADRTPFPTYVCLPSGLYKARTGQVVAQTGPEQEILSLPGIYFFDGWRIHYVANPRPPAKRERGASSRCRSDCTGTWYRTHAVAGRRSERHPSSSCQESARRWAMYFLLMRTQLQFLSCTQCQFGNE